MDAIYKTTSATLLIDFKNNFFTPDNREIFALIDDERISFDGEGFRISDSEKRLSPYEIDDFLGHFDDLGTLEQAGFIELPLIYELFSYYIESSWENEEIQKYIGTQREPKDGKDIYWDVYDKFEYIYNECLSYGKRKKDQKKRNEK